MLGLAAIIAMNTAFADPFPDKASHESLPMRQVDRELALPRGVLEVGVGAHHKSTGWFRDFSGWETRWNNGAVWHYSEARLSVDLGLSRRIRLMLRVPWVWARMRNDIGASPSTFALGDAQAGVLVQPWLDGKAKLAGSVWLKAPSGSEWPGAFASGPDLVDGFLTGTGITNLTLQLHGTRTLGRHLRFGARAGWTHKFAGIVGYVVESDGFGNGWLKPGNAVDLSATVDVQIVDGLAISVTPAWSRRGIYRTGVSGPSAGFSEWFVTRDAAAFSTLEAAIDADFSAIIGASVSGGVQLSGGETLSYAVLGLEEFSPQPGLWLAGTVRVRP